MRRLNRRIINDWFNALDQGADAFLDFAENIHINECCTQGGEKVIYIEDGIYYLARGYRMGENDGEKEKAIIEELEACGMEFKKDF